MTVRCGLLGTIMSPISLSGKLGPFRDILQVGNEILSCSADVQIIVRNDFDCGDWLLYVVSSVTLQCLQGRT